MGENALFPDESRLDRVRGIVAVFGCFTHSAFARKAGRLALGLLPVPTQPDGPDRAFDPAILSHDL